MYVCAAKFARRLPVPCLYANHVTLPGNVIRHVHDELQWVPMLKTKTSKRIFYTCENKKNTELVCHIIIFSTIEEIIMQPLQEKENFSILKGKKYRKLREGVNCTKTVHVVAHQHHFSG